jgi:hypothetical protein
LAYGSLSQERRRVLHAGIVQAIQREHAGRLDEHVEALAQHALRGELWDQAARYFAQAAAKAVARSANREALALLEQSAAALARLPPGDDTLRRELDLCIASRAPLVSVEGASAPAVDAAYRKARELCQRLGDTSRLFPVLWGSWYVCFSRRESERACELGEQLLALAQRSGERAVLLEAHHTMWTTHSQLGDWRAAREHLQRGLALYEKHEHRALAFVYGAHDPGVCCRTFVAGGMWAAGYPEQGLTYALEAVALAREMPHGAALTTALALHRATLVHHLRGEHESTMRYAQSIVDSADPGTHRSCCTDAEILLARLTAGEADSAPRLTRLAASLPAERLRGGYWRDMICLLLLSEGFAAAGRPQEGLALLRGPVEAGFSGYFAPEAYRIYGGLAREAGAPAAEAQPWLLRARDMARAREERSFELRATLDLARLLAAAGERSHAQQALQAIYDRFSEGFATRDLAQARALLEEL